MMVIHDNDGYTYTWPHGLSVNLGFAGLEGIFFQWVHLYLLGRY